MEFVLREDIIPTLALLYSTVSCTTSARILKDMLRHTRDTLGAHYTMTGSNRGEVEIRVKEMRRGW
eukprot:9082622-Pyramimonas_sp.AAC.1